VINEEIARRTLSLEMQVSKATGKEILKALKGLLHQLSKIWSKRASWKKFPFRKPNSGN